MADYTLEVVTRKDISYDKSKVYARISCDAFRNDLIAKAFTTVDNSLADDEIPSIYNYEKLRHKVNIFERNVENSARGIHELLLGEDRARLFFLKRNSEYVAASFFMLPKYAAPKTRLSFFEWIKYLYLKSYYWFTSKKDTFDYSGFIGELIWAKHHTGVGNDKETLNVIKNAKPETLEATGYPMDDAYSLCIFTVKSEEHGKGVGKVFMNKIIEHIKSIAIPPPDFGPEAKAKFILQSVPTARGFYDKLGFRCCGTASHVVNGIALDHSTYFKNL